MAVNFAEWYTGVDPMENKVHIPMLFVWDFFDML